MQHQHRDQRPERIRRCRRTIREDSAGVGAKRWQCGQARWSGAELPAGRVPTSGANKYCPGRWWRRWVACAAVGTGYLQLAPSLVKISMDLLL